MRKVFLTTLLFCIVAGCGGGSSDELSESDNICGGTSKVEGLCGDECPRKPKDAEQKLCKSGPAYVVYENDCGGKTVTDPDTTEFMRMTGSAYFAGNSYFFDDDDELVGGSNWSDAIDPRCTTPPFYGEKCKSTSDGEFHRCED